MLWLNSFDLVPKPVSVWENDEDFLTLKKIVRNMTLTNDAAERGILLAKDLQGNISYNEDERKKLILAIPEHCHRLRSLKREGLIDFYENLPV